MATIPLKRKNKFKIDFIDGANKNKQLLNPRHLATKSCVFAWLVIFS